MSSKQSLVIRRAQDLAYHVGFPWSIQWYQAANHY